MTAPKPTTSDTGVDITNLQVGERLRLDGLNGEAEATIVRMDSPRMGVVELNGGKRAIFHAYNVTARFGVHNVSDDQIGGYWDRHIGPGLLATGVPEDAAERMRRRYIADVRANPEALRQIAVEVAIMEKPVKRIKVANGPDAGIGNWTGWDLGEEHRLSFGQDGDGDGPWVCYLSMPGEDLFCEVNRNDIAGFARMLLAMVGERQ